MTPTTQALQVFYGTLPLIAVLAGIWLREQMLLKDILERLRSLEATLAKAVERLSRLQLKRFVEAR